MNSNNDSSNKLHPIHQKPPSSFRLLKSLALLATVLLIALVVGTSGYLLGIRNNQPAPQLQPSPLPRATIITQISATITLSPPIITEQPASSLIPDEFVNWKTHRGSTGYSIKYPANTELIDSDYFDFQLENKDLLITFINAVIPEEQEVEDHLINGFCFAKKSDIKKEKVNDLYIYRSEKIYDKNNICMQATIDMDKKRIIDIQGKAKNQIGIDQFNKILSSFQHTQ